MFKNPIWIFVIALFVLAVFLPSYSKMQDLKQKNLEYLAEIERLEAQRLKLLEEKRRLESDPVYLEKIAREKMGLIKEGEVVYEITPAVNAVE